jgi:hypothetical protein
VRKEIATKKAKIATTDQKQTELPAMQFVKNFEPTFAITV